MDLKEIEKLMASMQKAGLKRLVLKKEGFEIELEREGAFIAAPTSYSAPPQPQQQFMNREAPQESTTRPLIAKETSSSNYVKSPMVGTYYSSPSPDDPPFIKVGDVINENTVMCIIEAMKVMNEVKAGLKGKVVEVLLKNGDPVEFGTKLFRIE